MSVVPTVSGEAIAMPVVRDSIVKASSTLGDSTRSWGPRASVSLYLDRCQVDTPHRLISEVWSRVSEHRARVDMVVDFGAGDGRFAVGGSYLQYVGYEVDSSRGASALLPTAARLIHRCAFADEISNADLCIGNPPYVRNQDLPVGWRQQATAALARRTGVTLSGLANAWQYFFLLSLASTKDDGLIAIVIPFEWVSRPAARKLREHIRANRWGVSVYRLRDDTFNGVLTTSSVTIVDKRAADGSWTFYEETGLGEYRLLRSESGGELGVVAYAAHRPEKMRAKRGLSPGTQAVLTLTEQQRKEHKLRVGVDVVRCITSLKSVDAACVAITKRVFDDQLRRAGAKCWLIRTDKRPSIRLRKYLAGVNKASHQTATCNARERWWEFSMPEPPALLVASGFRGDRPKVYVNTVAARAVGGVCGVYGLDVELRSDVVRAFRRLGFSDKVVPYSNGFKKLEINQLNTVFAALSTQLRR